MTRGIIDEKVLTELGGVFQGQTFSGASSAARFELKESIGSDSVGDGSGGSIRGIVH
jgi:hypothetical protein